MQVWGLKYPISTQVNNKSTWLQVTYLVKYGKLLLYRHCSRGRQRHTTDTIRPIRNNLPAPETKTWREFSVCLNTVWLSVQTNFTITFVKLHRESKTESVRHQVFVYLFIFCSSLLVQCIASGLQPPQSINILLHSYIASYSNLIQNLLLPSRPV